ncbi:kh domain-containing [Cystoisospora suis]|uniref:Kh domain-containing n=1 Tax=Cystoisospora suis TaxID=483139 RepID=A0A2C6L3Y6_9APIC|nr:kh domain-containing [Cystoisospora suis]
MTTSGAAESGTGPRPARPLAVARAALEQLKTCNGSPAGSRLPPGLALKPNHVESADRSARVPPDGTYAGDSAKSGDGGHNDRLGDSVLLRQQGETRLSSNNTTAAPCYVKMLISNQLAGMVIGNTGNEIKHLKQSTGAKIVLSPHGMYFPGTTERLVAAEGTERAVFQVIDWIIDRMHELNEAVASSAVVDNSLQTLRNGRTKSTASLPALSRSLICKICVPRAVIGSLIGKNGGYIQSVRIATEANINISPLFVTADEACAERIVTVESARKQSLRTAVFTLARKINTHPEKATCKHVCYYRKLNFESSHLVAVNNKKDNRNVAVQNSPGAQQQNYLDHQPSSDAASHSSNEEADVFSVTSRFGTTTTPKGSRSSLSRIGGAPDGFAAFEEFSLKLSRVQQKPAPVLPSLVSAAETLKQLSHGGHVQDASTAVDSGSDQGASSPGTTREHLRREFFDGCARPTDQTVDSRAARLTGSLASTLQAVTDRQQCLGAGKKHSDGQRVDDSTTQPDASDDENLYASHESLSTVCTTAPGSMAQLASILQSIQEESNQQQVNYAETGSSKGSKGLDASAPEFFPLRCRTEEVLGGTRKMFVNVIPPSGEDRCTLQVPTNARADSVITRVHNGLQGSGSGHITSAQSPQQTKPVDTQSLTSSAAAGRAVTVASATTAQTRSGLGLLDEGVLVFMKIWTVALVCGVLLAVIGKLLLSW